MVELQNRIQRLREENLSLRRLLLRRPLIVNKRGKPLEDNTAPSIVK